MKNKTKSSPDHEKEKSFSESLPEDYPWKVLGWLSEDLCQSLDPVEQKYISEIVRTRRLSLLLRLPSLWGLQSMASQRCSLAEMRAKYQLAALLKNFQFPSERSTQKLAAIEKLRDGESKCAEYNREGYLRCSWAKEAWMVDVFTYAQQFMRKLLGDDLPPLDVMTERSRHGPGATCDTEAGRVSSYFKFEKWPYQCTQGAARYARYAIGSDDRWLGALEDDYRRRYNIPMYQILDRQVFWDTVIEVVEGNRIAFVPKNALTMRSIAIEPTLNLYLQLGVDGFIRRRLRRWGVDLNSQEKNQELARLGSLPGEDPFVTIDLKNASNCISLKLPEMLCPKEWYDYLIALRSPQGDMGDGQLIQYEMISSMGNGYTFALESALFAAIIYGVRRQAGLKHDPNEWAVFGDDLIIRQSLSRRLVEALSNCGFEINEDKSFFEGPTRESCGTDWYQGRPVRPVFLDDIPNEVDELLSAINRIKRILSLRWGIEESKTVACMTKWIPEKIRELKGPYSDDNFDSYIHWPVPTRPMERWVYKYRGLCRRPEEEKAPSLFFRKLMHDLHPRPVTITKWDWRRKLAGSGSRFSVYRRNSYTLGTCYSVSEIWRSEYSE